MSIDRLIDRKLTSRAMKLEVPGAGLTRVTGGACALAFALGAIVLAWSSRVFAEDPSVDVDPSPPALERAAEFRDERCAPEVKERCVPREPTLAPNGARWNAGVALGSCLRDDPLVGGSGACGEVHGGGSFLLGQGKNARKWRIVAELGLGFVPSKTLGYSGLGLVESAGGGYLAPRLMLGYHWSPIFFTQFGAQVRLGHLMSIVTWSVQSVIELGTSILYPNIEIGVRELVGSDVVASSAPDVSTYTSQTFSAGTVGFARLLLP